jgi:plastocyanin
MTRITLLAGTALAALALAAQTIFAAPGATKLKGDVGPGFTIHLKDAAGKTVKTLKAATYSVTVDDKSKIHNFKFEGPGVQKEITGIKFVGKKTATVTFKRGKYTYVCTPHRKIPTMKGTFTVT